MTIDKNEGISPGSGSSEKGFGKVVRAAIGEGLAEVDPDGGRREEVSMCRLGAADIFAGFADSRLRCVSSGLRGPSRE